MLCVCSKIKDILYSTLVLISQRNEYSSFCFILKRLNDHLLNSYLETHIDVWIPYPKGKRVPLTSEYSLTFKKYLVWHLAEGKLCISENINRLT